MRPGEILFGEGPIRLNAGRATAEVTVTNTSDHTVWVSSHFPFFEVNRRLVFDRSRAWGMHLDSPAGDSVRWGPGETRTVGLVAVSCPAPSTPRATDPRPAIGSGWGTRISSP
jgi:urease beta subunit